MEAHPGYGGSPWPGAMDADPKAEQAHPWAAEADPEPCRLPWSHGG